MALRAFLLQNLEHNLLATSELCDTGCTIIFQQHGVDVKANGEIILLGWLGSTVTPVACATHGQCSTTTNPIHQPQWTPRTCHKSPVTQYLWLWQHQAIYGILSCNFFLSFKSKWLQAIEWGYLQGCPGLMADHAMKYIHGIKTTMTKGHLNQTRQGTWLTAMDDHPNKNPATWRQTMFLLP